MIISSYNGKGWKHCDLQVDFDENHFPTKYIVTDTEYKQTKFPPTKKGAQEARKYYENLISIYKYSE